jgi:hypothetical protein
VPKSVGSMSLWVSVICLRLRQESVPDLIVERQHCAQHFVVSGSYGLERGQCDAQYSQSSNAKQASELISGMSLRPLSPDGAPVWCAGEKIRTAIVMCLHGQ